MNGRDVVRLGLLSAPRRPIVTKHAHRTSGVPLRVNCSCATRKQLRGPLLSVKNASPCADLELATHRRLKIPIWMQSRDCADLNITERPHLSKEALLSLAALMSSQLDSKDHKHDNLPQTAVDGCKGGRRGATTTSGREDRKRERSGIAGRRSDTLRSDRSHGPRSSGGLSSGRRKSG